MIRSKYVCTRQRGFNFYHFGAYAYVHKEVPHTMVVFSGIVGRFPC